MAHRGEVTAFFEESRDFKGIRRKRRETAEKTGQNDDAILHRQFFRLEKREQKSEQQTTEQVDDDRTPRMFAEQLCRELVDAETRERSNRSGHTNTDDLSERCHYDLLPVDALSDDELAALAFASDLAVSDLVTSDFFSLPELLELPVLSGFAADSPFLYDSLR